MNQQQRQQYSELSSRRMKRWEVLFTRAIYKVLHAQVAHSADTLKQRGVHALRDDLDSLIMIHNLGVVIQRLYVFVGLKTANRTFREINASVKVVAEKRMGLGFDEKWTRAILDFFRLYLLSKAVLPISAEIKRLILEILDKGLNEGWSIDRMANEMESATFPLTRARMIARTEILKAQFYGEELAKQDTIWETTEIWIAAKDHRTRHSHRDIDGETINTGNRFRVERFRGNTLIGYDMMLGPGDPDASPENVINCRCTRVVRAARDNNGRLIRKSKISVALPGSFTQPSPTITI